MGRQISHFWGEMTVNFEVLSDAEKSDAVVSMIETQHKDCWLL
jgi:hypothetical protein